MQKFWLVSQLSFILPVTRRNFLRLMHSFIYKQQTTRFYGLLDDKPFGMLEEDENSVFIIKRLLQPAHSCNEQKY